MVQAGEVLQRFGYGGGECRWNEVEILAGLEPQQNDVDGGRRFSSKIVRAVRQRQYALRTRLRLCRMMIRSGEFVQGVVRCISGCY